MTTYKLIWAPSWTTIAVVVAKSATEARRKAPSPWRKYLGEIAVEVVK